MSIIISNLGNNPSPFGVHPYVVRINDKVITNFTHVREEGLATCLRKAADAVDKEEREGFIRFLQEMETWEKTR